MAPKRSGPDARFRAAPKKASASAHAEVTGTIAESSAMEPKPKSAAMFKSSQVIRPVQKRQAEGGASSAASEPVWPPAKKPRWQSHGGGASGFGKSGGKLQSQSQSGKSSSSWGFKSTRKPAKAKSAKDELDEAHLELFSEAISAAGGEIDGGGWEVASARGWKCLQTLLGEDSVDEPAAIEDPRLLQASTAIGFEQVPETLDHDFANQLYRKGHYIGHYLYLSNHPDFDKSSYINKSGEDLPKVLMVAEKPSIAKAIAEHLTNGRYRTRRTCSRACQTYEFITWFPQLESKCKFIQTSTIGHVFNLSFESQRGIKPEQCFEIPTQKEVEEHSAKNRVVEMLRELASECQHLVLWLDCDREGENICYEIIGICREHFPSDQDIYRAKFSALTQVEIKGAFKQLSKPNAYMAMAVDARQELDLRVGVAFTRLLTWSFLDMAKAKFPKYKDLKVLSYGPCQTPTLWFCVQRHQEIQKFKPKEYWVPRFRVNVGGQVQSLSCTCAEDEKVWDQAEAQRLLNLTKAGSATAVNVEQQPKVAKRPVGLSTVQLLKAGSTGLGISPGTVMRVAESLYSHGYISYPRTETSRYPPSFDVTSVLWEQAQHPTWGRTVHWLLQSHGGRVKPPSEGHDAGDHPPITPLRLASRDDFQKGKEWRIYDLVCRHFIASLLPDVEYTEHKLTVDVGGQHFTSIWHTIQERGFLFAMPWKQQDMGISEPGSPEDEKQAGGKAKGRKGSKEALEVPSIPSGKCLEISDAELHYDKTRHPEYLKESELISLMDEHGIGTDATMAQHIDNVVTRNYVKVCEPSEEPGKPGPQIWEKKGGWKPKGKGKNKGDDGPQKPKARHMVPTGLGLAILDMSFTSVEICQFHRLVPDLCEPPVRAYMEKQCAQVADGVASQEKVVSENIATFREKFNAFEKGLPRVQHILAPKDGSWEDKASWGGSGGSSWGGGGSSWRSGGNTWNAGKGSGAGAWNSGGHTGTIQPGGGAGLKRKWAS